MGFLKPDVPQAPAPVYAPSPSDIGQTEAARAKTQADMAAAEAKQRKLLGAGRTSTMTQGYLGDTSQAPVSKRQLLGT